MKRQIIFVAISILTLAAAGCSNEDSAPAEQAPVVEAEAPEATPEVAETAAPVAESLEVVEESAAEAEPSSQKIILAQADDVAVARNWQFNEGEHYTQLIPTQRTVGGADKIEVAEVFMYSCPHCYDLEPYINSWAEGKDPNVRFVRIPAIFNQLAQLHAQLYYTEVFLTQSGKLKDQTAFRELVFEEFHRKGNRLTSQAAIQRVFAKAGISEDDFNRTWSSFEVNQALRVASDLARRYNISSVPTIVVNGKYSTDAGHAGSYPKLVELIDELTVREGLR
jgi:thiol:disulfide interchange protein DsbA